MKRTIGERVFTVFNAFLLLLVVLSIVLPLMNIFSISVSDNAAIVSKSVSLFPVGFNLRAYQDVLSKAQFRSSFVNSIVLTVVYTVLALIVNTMAAYSFSKPFFGKQVLMYLFVFTMYFSGGLIPSYMLITQTLNLYNNYLAFLLPSLVSVFYIIIIRSQIESLPPSLSDAAEIDGANQFQLLIHIIIPAISSTMAAICMFLALNMWNMWYPVLLYTDKESMWTLQYMLRAIVFEMTLQSSDTLAAQASAVNAEDAISPYNFQNAAIILVALPIVCIYPFVQKYFVKGILVGSVKE
ncbi:MAG: carbohydrate ABC transporter permease [Clostridiaceae bacterium]|nr:carbohydrate ABC transporter permease [Clostridiaceae bacterium]